VKSCLVFCNFSTIWFSSPTFVKFFCQILDLVTALPLLRYCISKIDSLNFLYAAWLDFNVGNISVVAQCNTVSLVKAKTETKHYWAHICGKNVIMSAMETRTFVVANTEVCACFSSLETSMMELFFKNSKNLVFESFC